jgi:hypothetical protein
VTFVIPSEARDLLFFTTPKEKQIPRANPALRNDKICYFFRSLFSLWGFPLTWLAQNPQTEVCATKNQSHKGDAGNVRAARSPLALAHLYA